MKYLLVLLLLLMPVSALAEADCPEWIEISGGDTVLTVRLPAEDAREWVFDIAGDGALELLTMEMLGDEPGEENVPMQWVASFAAFGAGGTSKLRLYADAERLEAAEIRVAMVDVAEDHALTLQSVQVLPEIDDWYFVDDTGTLHLRLQENPSTGYGWRWTASVPETLAMIADEFVMRDMTGNICGAGGTRIVAFHGAQSGEVTLKVEYARAWEDEAIDTRELHLTAGEDGVLRVIE